MKTIKTLMLAGIGALATACALTACSDEAFTPSIFDTEARSLDRTQYTFPLDTFAKANFLEPYNLRYIYKMEDMGTDMQKNLVPATYENSKKLAVLAKYLWFDVYDQLGGPVFLKKNSPRIILLMGSPGINPSQHTETLGTAEGGLKVYLYKVNSINENNIEHLNTYFFHVMHHEFGHILDQTSSRPQAFNLLSNGKYDALSWSQAHDSLVVGRGFITPYASSNTADDWVELLSEYVCCDTLEWERKMNAARYEWESIDINTNQVDSIISLLNHSDCPDTIGFPQLPNGQTEYKLIRKVIKRNADGSASLADGKIQPEDKDGIDGYTLIQSKLDMIRQWLKEYFDIDIDHMRQMIQSRSYVTDAQGNYLFEGPKYIQQRVGNSATENRTYRVYKGGTARNKLVAPLASDPTRTVMDSLLYQIDQFEELIIKN